MGISTQRSTFITWNRETGETFHNFITWKDLRADEMVRKWNSSVALKVMHGVSHCLYFVTRSKRFLAGSVIKLMNAQTTPRLCWMLQNNKKLQQAIEDKCALFGTLDSWLLYRLRQGKSRSKYVEHISDVTSCAATGFYDPFTMQWAKWAVSLFSIKVPSDAFQLFNFCPNWCFVLLQMELLPKVVDDSYDFGYIDRELFGHEIRIGCSVRKVHSFCIRIEI